MKTGFKMLKLFIFYVISSVSSIIIFFLNKDFVKPGGTDAVTQLGYGLSKIIIIPLYIILFLVAISLALSSFFTSIGLTKAESKTVKVISIIMIILTLALLGFITYTLIQTINVI